MLSSITKHFEGQCMNPLLFLFYLFIMASIFLMIMSSSDSGRQSERSSIMSYVGGLPTYSG